MQEANLVIVSPEGEELAMAAVYDNDTTNNGWSSIAGMIQQNQWQ
jgi:hypothetical protein